MSAAPRLISYQSIETGGGGIGVVEASHHTGFDAKRIYFLHGMSGDDVRGNHAHKSLRQFIFCVAGQVRVTLEGSAGRFVFDLTTEPSGILIPPGYWRELDCFAPGTVVVVLASEEYDEADYIRDYGAFTDWLATNSKLSAVPYIPLDRQHRDLSFQLERAMEDVIKSGIFVGGPAVARFEAEFARLCETAQAVGCSNGLDALVVALEAVGIGPGHDVVVPANSFIASALAVSITGATPVFADIDPDTYGITAETLEAAITPRSAAVMPVHLYGIPVDMDGIGRVAAAHGLKLIEDVAQAHGATFRGRTCGSFGDAAGFSFYPTKVLGALGDAGAVTTNDPQLAERIRLICNYGSRKKYHHEIAGRNCRLDPIQAAALCAKLAHLASWNERRHTLANRYLKGLAPVNWLTLPRVPDDRVPAWHVFPIRVNLRSRDELAYYLAQRGIQTNLHYPLPIHLQPAYAHLGYKPGAFPVTEASSRELLSLPLDPYHTDAEIDRVIEVLSGF